MRALDVLAASFFSFEEFVGDVRQQQREKERGKETRYLEETLI